MQVLGPPELRESRQLPQMTAEGTRPESLHSREAEPLGPVATPSGPGQSALTSALTSHSSALLGCGEAPHPGHTQLWVDTVRRKRQWVTGTTGQVVQPARCHRAQAGNSAGDGLQVATQAPGRRQRVQAQDQAPGLGSALSTLPLPLAWPGAPSRPLCFSAYPCPPQHG